VDLADPELNTSGVPWSTLYYQENYRRLQKQNRLHVVSHVAV
jgi:aclacinomycin oxidase